MTDERLLARNLRVYSWVRMLTMRVYLPLTAIYLAEVGHLNIKQLGLLITIAGITSVVSNVPTGYLADRWTRKSALVTGAVLLCIASLTYALFPSFPGAIVAVIIESLGYSVIAGAGEAMIHDTLVYQGRAKDYVKTVGHAQSMALVGNVILVGLVPLSYGVNKHLPFFIGAFAAMIFIYLANSLVEPPRPAHQTTEQPYNLVKVLRVFVNRRTVLFFIALGLLSNAYRSYTPITNLAFKDMGLSPAFFGFAFSAGSVIGAINGHFIGMFKRLTLRQYALFDIALCVSYPISIWLTHNLVVAIVLFMFDLGFWRVRNIVYQGHLLKHFSNQRYKATLISTMSLFDNINIWQPIAFSFVISSYGYYNGLGYISIAVFFTMVTIFMIATKVLDKPGLELTKD